jgi:hypothetical protein
MIEFRDHPLLCGVTAVARLLGSQMLGGHANCANRVMATGAGLGCAGKSCAGMAVLAMNRFVGTGQWKAGLVVIETAIDLTAGGQKGLSGGQHDRQHEKQRNQALPKMDTCSPFFAGVRHGSLRNANLLACDPRLVCPAMLSNEETERVDSRTLVGAPQVRFTGKAAAL